MIDNWIKIYSSSQFYDIEMAKAILLDNGIESVEISKKDSAYLFGEIELYVEKEKAFQAKQIISNL